MGISRPTLSNYSSTGKIWNNLYTFKIFNYSPTPLNINKVPLMPKSESLKGFTVEVLNNEGIVVDKFSSIKITADTLGLSRHSVRKYADRA